MGSENLLLLGRIRECQGSISGESALRGSQLLLMFPDPAVFTSCYGKLYQNTIRKRDALGHTVDTAVVRTITVKRLVKTDHMRRRPSLFLSGANLCKIVSNALA